MAKTKSLLSKDIIRTEEFFELRLLCDTKVIDVHSLIKYLTQANSMVQGINETLNFDYTVGYDLIEVDVFAIEQGSVRIPLLLKKYAAPMIIGVATTFIGGVAVNLVSGNKGPIIVASETGDIKTESSTFLENRQTRQSVSTIAKMVAEDDGITGLEITYEKADGQRESLTISKKTLAGVAEECGEMEDDIINCFPNTKLQIYGPILENTPSSWRVKMNGKKISACMTDSEFLDEMTAKKIAFAPDDEIIADLEEVISEDAKGKHTKWYIRKVHSYPKYTRITKHQEQQATLNL